jgi:hypothetical protein
MESNVSYLFSTISRYVINDQIIVIIFKLSALKFPWYSMIMGNFYFFFQVNLKVIYQLNVSGSIILFYLFYVIILFIYIFST